jgi:hypothetical protein
MKTATERFKVQEVIKFGMLFGYRVWDTVEKTALPYEFDCDEKHKAESRCERSNLYQSL